jgi:hypothetical protein
MTIQNLKLRIIPKFPASVSVGSGLTLTNTNGAYSITLANNLTQVAALSLGPNQAIYWPSLGVAGSLFDHLDRPHDGRSQLCAHKFGADRREWLAFIH